MHAQHGQHWIAARAALDCSMHAMPMAEACIAAVLQLTAGCGAGIGCVSQGAAGAGGAAAGGQPLPLLRGLHHLGPPPLPGTAGTRPQYCICICGWEAWHMHALASGGPASNHSPTWMLPPTPQRCQPAMFRALLLADTCRTADLPCRLSSAHPNVGPLTLLSGP